LRVTADIDVHLIVKQWDRYDRWLYWSGGVYYYLSLQKAKRNISTGVFASDSRRRCKAWWVGILTCGHLCINLKNIVMDKSGDDGLCWCPLGLGGQSFNSWHLDKLREARALIDASGLWTFSSWRWMVAWSWKEHCQKIARAVRILLWLDQASFWKNGIIKGAWFGRYGVRICPECFVNGKKTPKYFSAMALTGWPEFSLPWPFDGTLVDSVSWIFANCRLIAFLAGFGAALPLLKEAGYGLWVGFLFC